MARKDWLTLILLSLLWGGSFVFVELALRGLPALSIVWGRVALAAVILAIVLRASGLSFPAPALWPALLVMGVLNNAIPFTLFVLAQGEISGALASILNATTPLLTAVVAHLATTDERLTRSKGLGLALGLGGVVVMLGGAGAAGEAWAKVACLGAALSYALAGVWGRRFRQRGAAPLATAFGQVAASSLVLLPLWLWIDRPWHLPMPGGEVIAAMVGLAALSTALAYGLFFRLLASAGATRLSLVTFLIPISATAMGVAFLGETLKVQHFAGFLLIAAGLVAIGGRPPGKAPG
jgi:drug/metabolite transporter (DMT)-like permease